MAVTYGSVLSASTREMDVFNYSAFMRFWHKLRWLTRMQFYGYPYLSAMDVKVIMVVLKSKPKRKEKC